MAFLKSPFARTHTVQSFIFYILIKIVFSTMPFYSERYITVCESSGNEVVYWFYLKWLHRLRTLFFPLIQSSSFSISLPHSRSVCFVLFFSHVIQFYSLSTHINIRSLHLVYEMLHILSGLCKRVFAHTFDYTFQHFAMHKFTKRQNF